MQNKKIILFSFIFSFTFLVLWGKHEINHKSPTRNDLKTFCIVKNDNLNHIVKMLFIIEPYLL